MAVITKPSATTAAAPFNNAAGSSILSRTATPARMPTAIDRARRVTATLAIFCSPPMVVILTKPHTNTINPARNSAPLPISSRLRRLTSLHTPTINIKEIEMDSKRPPSLAICLSAPIFVTATRTPMNAKKPLANNAPFFISSGVN